MANALFDKGRNRFLTGDTRWLADDIRAILVDTAGYAANLNTHEFLSAIPAAARVAVAALPSATRTAVDGVADAADVTFPAVSATAPTVEAIVLYKHVVDVNGVLLEGSSALIAYIDTATGLPVTPNGGDLIVRWSDLANRIFKL